ncbi:alpha/beta fold hydrolase [Shouchella clausii]|uniref:Alpha/beta hydrolase n=1 Tax=Shouchella clausii TaxID=79880 RepID=A0A268RWB4_SHOCL|nr:alpha/beta hydrolase [Shouchella clausii]PAD41537.1 alpha/beta hydrolase [Bacillus sp. 7520-S]SPU21237.1 alpha/beta hydrolase [Niallia circulans]AST94920.1 alpha/beta hydrolase [Shouchella clausii]MBU8598377.1 alpha/beta hydrolase [Shouchella clausii]MCM3549308.1 alpha/beta hydrolase [Shouchella clausii]
MEKYKHHIVETGGHTFHIVSAGQEDGELVLLLHGFPEFWYGFRHQINALARAGYRVIVPDQRGYNQSDKPRDIKAYTLDVLRDDCVAFIKAFGRKQAYLIGHDWGGAVAWHLAASKPEVVKKLVAINIPHPADMRVALMKRPLQLFRSAYMLFFQVPYAPEKLLAARDFAYLEAGMTKTANERAFTKAELRHYKTAWRQPGALKGMLNWYRAVRFQGLDRKTELDLPVSVPTRIIWGANDLFLGKALAQASLKRCSNGDAVLVDGATHWLHHEHPEIVNHLMLEHLQKQKKRLWPV